MVKKAPLQFRRALSDLAKADTIEQDILQGIEDFAEIPSFEKLKELTLESQKQVMRQIADIEELFEVQKR